MERQIGEQFDYKDVTLEVVEEMEYPCEGCYFAGLVLCLIRETISNTGSCCSANRYDGKDVIFKEVQQ